MLLKIKIVQTRIHLCCLKTSASFVIQQHCFPEFLPVKLTLAHQTLQLFQKYRKEFLVTPCLEKKGGSQDNADENLRQLVKYTIFIT